MTRWGCIGLCLLAVSNPPVNVTEAFIVPETGTVNIAIAECPPFLPEWLCL